MSEKEDALFFNFKGGLFSNIQRARPFPSFSREPHANKITWLGLGWQYHGAKQFLYFSHDPQFKQYGVSSLP